MSDVGQTTEGWVMGRQRRRHPEDPDAEDGDGPGVYRVEVDSERHHFHGDVPFSFWGSAKATLFLSVVLFWLPQSAGYMVAGYVGGRRAGAPWRAVLASLIPVIIIYGASAAYGAGLGRAQIDFIAALPASVTLAVGQLVPFLEPYARFVVDYLATFVAALQQVFGMGTNGYLVTIAFAYVGGLVGDQTRREIAAKSSAAGSTSVRIVQPVVERLHVGGRDEPELVPRHPHRARGYPEPFSAYHKVPAQIETRRHAAPVHRRIVHEPPEPEDEERTEDREETREGPAPHHRREPDNATRRFVERALRQYEHARPHHSRD